MTMKNLLVAITLLLTAATSYAGQELQFVDAYIPAAPPGAKTMAAYLTINNTGNKDTKIVSVSCDEFESTEIHRSIVENDVAKMEHVPELTIPAKTQVILSPGGLHLMLINPLEEILPGELVSLKFKESDGTEHSLTVKVKFVYHSDSQHDHHQQ